MGEISSLKAELKKVKEDQKVDLQKVDSRMANMMEIVIQTE